MITRFLLLIIFVVAAYSGSMAQTAGTPKGPVPNMKVAIVDVLAFREKVHELKARYDKLQAEFAPRYQQLEAMQTKLAAQEKTLAENQNMTPQQAGKLNEDFQQGKKEYQRLLEDSQSEAQKREEEETGPIYDKLSKFLDQFCTQHGITAVFDARRLQETGLVVYAVSTANITDIFVDAYNKANPAPSQSATASPKP